MIWITYTPKYPVGRSYQGDAEPTTYSNISVHTEEMAALRFANDHRCAAIRIGPGQTLEQAITADQAARRSGRNQ